jgi:hypothetical protein
MGVKLDHEKEVRTLTMLIMVDGFPFLVNGLGTLHVSSQAGHLCLDLIPPDSW